MMVTGWIIVLFGVTVKTLFQEQVFYHLGLHNSRSLQAWIIYSNCDGRSDHKSPKAVLSGLSGNALAAPYLHISISLRSSSKPYKGCIPLIAIYPDGWQAILWIPFPTI
jgi:hypothetical protein